MKLIAVKYFQKRFGLRKYQISTDLHMKSVKSTYKISSLWWFLSVISFVLLLGIGFSLIISDIADYVSSEINE